MKKIYKDFKELPISLNAEDIAKILNISRPYAYQLLKEGKIPTLRLGKRILVPKNEFLKWIEENTVSSVKEVL
ncbi:helix-turn-helix domain-containing protein [Herbivorax sp. ANBcel31]|uniref:helix-turn-helix domain-containing protein n=1 Tax=Herbivorax sp. ANBcel31 TaxID=3069754 RepID=UPI0027B0AFC5|nr:helix-turn-helix domain-containing protein [Herbivorax sp. ANBcel31]MDQ2086480.1 helix-turn-helix domain-containing protein [Herbivorax sp. ANBcel31]